MALQGLSTRATRDVDVLGVWDSHLDEVICIKEFPDKVKSCIKRVLNDHPELSGLRENWINLGPSNLATIGLPEGFGTRLKTMKFGKALTLHLLGRIDLIPLKLYAASDRFSSRQEIHFVDLQLMKPTFNELNGALEWVGKLKDFEEKRPEIQCVLERLGYDDLAGYV